MTASKENVLIYCSGKQSINEAEYEVVERKGIGHPDSICDGMAESISGAYSKYCLERYGAILRHMIDKLAIQGGASQVVFGGGKMIQPITVFLNGRFTRLYRDELIPYLDIVTGCVRNCLNKVLVNFDVEKWLKIVNNVHFSQGPGVVYDQNGTSKNERRFFFEIPEKEFLPYHDNNLKANDTSTSVAYYPLSYLEEIVLLVENTLNSPEFKKENPSVGTDIKVMGRRLRDQVGLTICIPLISSYIPDAESYHHTIKQLKEIVLQLISTAFGHFKFTIEVNTRDDGGKSDYYLTLTGSALESGDEGVVGRGNRHNGVISFTRHMSLEAACGKNPVYHVGKVYTALGSIIAKEIYKMTGRENCVYLTSQIGRSIQDPWSIAVEVSGVKLNQRYKKMIQEIVEAALANVRLVTNKIIKGEVILY